MVSRVLFYSVFFSFISYFSIHRIEDVSCLSFLEISEKNIATAGKDFVYVSPGTGCDSYIGRVGGRQDVHLLQDVRIIIIVC